MILVSSFVFIIQFLMFALHYNHSVFKKNNNTIVLHFPPVLSLLTQSIVLEPQLVLLFTPQQAGDKHYHPTCARCARCEQMFAEGEEMYLQGIHRSCYSENTSTVPDS